VPEIQAQWQVAKTTLDGDLIPGLHWSDWMDILEYEEIHNPFPTKMRLRLKPKESNERPHTHSIGA
jgi:hypothetical protein